MKLLKIINYLSFVITVSVLLTLFFFVSQIYPGDEPYPDHVHITLYLDRNFYDYETDAITKAALEWSEATNHIVEYDIVQLPSEEPIKYSNSLFIVKKSPDDPKILLMDFASKTETLGVYDRQGLPSISIVTERLADDNYKEVVLHELGHSLGLAHLEGQDNMDALMFPYTNIELDNGDIVPSGSDHITEKDLVAFCKLYRCDVSKLKH